MFLFILYTIYLYVNSKIIIKKEKIELIDANWTIPSGLVAVLLNKKFICTTLGSDIRLFYNKPFIRQLLKFILKKAELIDCVGEEYKERLIDMGIDKRKINILYLIINKDRFKDVYSKDKIKSKYNIKSEKILLYVGNFVPIKGPDNAVKAFVIVKKRFPNTKLIMIGKGPLKNKIDKIIEENNLQKEVVFNDTINDKELIGLIKTADIVLPPMTDKGVVSIQIEALMCSTPFIADFPKEASKISQVAIRADVSSYKDIAEKIIESLSKIEKIRRNIKSKRNEILELYSWEARTKKLNDIYKKF